jgi:hypothetical protein
MPVHKTNYQLGMEAVLNNPQTSFLHNPRTFHEIHRQSGMSMSAMMKHIGGQAKKQKEKGPTDAEKSEQRLKEMEAAQKK